MITDLPSKSHIHMIGIGGTGMRALAIILLEMGYSISGSDLSTNRKAVHDLVSKGAKIFDGHSECNIEKPSLVIRSAIIPDSNPEVITAQQKNIPVTYRTQALVEIANTKTIHAVAGSHGKSTATSMLVHILRKADLHFSWYFGSQMRDGTPESHWDNNSKLLILETDESDHGFLGYDIKNAVVICVDPEHMEFYDFDIDNLLGEFKTFIKNSAKKNGIQILNIDDVNTCKLISDCSGCFSIGYSNNSRLRALSSRFMFKDGYMGSESEISLDGKQVGILNLIVPGTHNVTNALTAIAGVTVFGVPVEDALDYLNSYQGLTRRIEPIAHQKGHIVFDDDAGHPMELKAGINTLKKYFPDRPLCIVHQPVRYSRVHYLAEQYAQVVKEMLSINDRYIASPAQPSDENKWNVNRHGITDAIIEANPRCVVTRVDSHDQIKKAVIKNLRENEILFLSGHPPSQIRKSAFSIANILKEDAHD